ncbi:MAG TPA: VUT family protein [Kofleriaceae bacterium]|nr:VUT family protein [Kofleriaceae bacterium]
MSTNSEDRWLLPRRQTEYPARDLLPEAQLHGRRELTFLSLAALHLVAITAFMVFGASRAIDVSGVVARVAPGYAAPVALVVPLGVLPFAASFIASALTCELFGRRRASALVWVGHVATAAIVGLLRVADLIDGGQAFGIALAFAACCVVGHASFVIVLDRLRRSARGRGSMLRIVAAAIGSLALGWAAFAIVLHAASGVLVDFVEREAIVAIAATSAASALALVIVLALPAAIVVRGLSLALRVGGDLLGDDMDEDEVEVAITPAASTRRAFAEGSVARKLPPAVIVDDDDASASPQPFSSAEMRFFSEGDMATE